MKVLRSPARLMVATLLALSSACSDQLVDIDLPDPVTVGGNTGPCPSGQTTAATGITPSAPIVGPVGTTGQLQPVFNCGSMSVTFYSTNESVVKVTTGGSYNIVGVGSGKICITGTTICVDVTGTGSGGNNNPVITGVNVTLLNPNIKFGACVGTNTTASAVVQGSNNPSQSVTWSSSNNSVATVTASGLVMGHGAGTANIVAQSSDPTKSGFATVTVTACDTGGGNNIVVPSHTSLNFTLCPQGYSGTSQPVTLSATYNGAPLAPADTRYSHGSEVIDVTATGVVSPTKLGATTLVLGPKSNTNHFVNIPVTVSNTGCVQQQQSVTVTPTGGTYTVGQRQTFTATVQPAGAEVEWSINIPACAELSPNGLTVSVLMVSACSAVELSARLKTNPQVRGTARFSITSGLVNCTINPTGGTMVNGVYRIQLSQTGRMHVSCSNQFGVSFLPFHDTDNPLVIRVTNGASQTVIDGTTWYTGPWADVFARGRGTAKYIVQARLTDQTVIATMNVEVF